mgnify:CR=1 FL=1
MIIQTQDQWLPLNYFGSSHEGVLAKINFRKVVNAFGIYMHQISYNNKILGGIKNSLKKRQSFCEILINKNKCLLHQVKFGHPNEDQEPLLFENEYYQNMIIQTIKR